MQRIWKYQIELTDIQTIFAPKNAEHLCVQVQHEVICIWVKVDLFNEVPEEEMTIFVHGTGHELLSQTAMYLGTFQKAGGDLIFHVFWEWKEQK